MDIQKRIELWRGEEKIAHIHGWDFSHIDGRYEEKEGLPWDYKAEILSRLMSDMKILDIDTGGGEFLLSLKHPYENTSAMEAYPPNAELCKDTLLPLGIDFRAGNGREAYPFPNESFDMVMNRHGDYNADEIHRILKKGGLFITQQVGAQNDRELVKLLMPDYEALPFPEQYADAAAEKFRLAGFEIIKKDECFRPIVFFDVGALVWFARIIEWEFPGFSVDNNRNELIHAQELIDRFGKIEGSIHRFLLVARKA
ncbi:MAG: methyltransferase domain-containing protein [Clostridia bacterium]|nr:methyltransferase domain-containing protein [Clostridia bacterium]